MQRVAALSRGVEAPRQLGAVRLEFSAHGGETRLGECQPQQEAVVARRIFQQRQYFGGTLLIDQEVRVGSLKIGVARIDGQCGVEMTLRIDGIAAPLRDFGRERQRPFTNAGIYGPATERFGQRKVGSSCFTSQACRCGVAGGSNQCNGKRRHVCAVRTCFRVTALNREHGSACKQRLTVRGLGAYQLAEIG